MSARLDALLGEQRRVVQAKDTSTWAEKTRIVLDSCHPRQRAFVEDPGRRVVALVARGGGKTTGGRARFVLRMLRTRKAKCLYIATTRQQAAELMWAPLKDLVEKLGIEARFNETQLKCTFLRNGAELRLVGADDKREIEKLRGLPHHEVGIDEAASYPAQILEHLLMRIIGPRLGDYGGVLWMIGTPGHVLAGPFYDATRPGSEIHRRWEDRDEPEYADWQRWSYHHWSVKDGAPFVPAMARLWAEAHVEKEANGWSDDNPVWLREYEGRWAADDTENIFKYRPHLDDGASWNQWDPPRDPRTGFAILPPGRWQYAYGMDMGHSDPYSLEVFAFDESGKDRTLYHAYEFVRRGMYARTIAELMLGPELSADRPAGVIGATGWPAGMVADMAGLGGAVLDELANVYGIAIEPAEKKNKHDAIELFNGDLIDGRIKILKGSQLEEQMLHLQWAVNDYGELKENKSQRNDCTDAAIYGRRLAWHLLGEEQPRERAPDDPRARYDRATEPAEDAQPRGEFDSILGTDDGYYDEGQWG